MKTEYVNDDKTHRRIDGSLFEEVPNKCFDDIAVVALHRSQDMNLFLAMQNLVRREAEYFENARKVSERNKQRR